MRSAVVGPSGFVKADRATLLGREILRGREVQVQGLGRCRFQSHVTNPRTGGVWLDLIDAKGRARCVTPDRVTRIHREAAR
jgi:hypothetical protein